MLVIMHSAGEGQRVLTCHWHVDGDGIPLLYALRLQPIGLHVKTQSLLLYGWRPQREASPAVQFGAAMTVSMGNIQSMQKPEYSLMCSNMSSCNALPVGLS